MNYPKDWPTCVFCGDPVLDGHLTCGRATCSESDARYLTDYDPDEVERD